MWSASQVLASAAIRVGKYAQSFPEFGPERTGAPVRAFNRIDDRPIVVHSHVYEPDAVVVIDPTLLQYAGQILSGVKEGGHVVVNSKSSPSEVRSRLGVPDGVEVWSVDATTIALEEVGRAVTNTPMLGVLVRATGAVPLEAVEEAVRARWPGEVGEKNVAALRRAHDEARSG